MLQKGIWGFFLGLVLFAVVPAWGQDTGTLTGTVTDSSSAVVANAQVTVTDAATNFETSTVTNSEGIYRITFLRPGTYRVRDYGFGLQNLCPGQCGIASRSDAAD